jgi:transcriptional regulator with XRE-family HTH domain
MVKIHSQIVNVAIYTCSWKLHTQANKEELQIVKKDRTIIPNVYLRSERELRGWTRASVAEKLNLADPKTVGRWERGVSSPNRHFQQRLCELFGKTPKELGLSQQTSDEQREKELTPPSALQSAHSFFPTGFLYDPATPSFTTFRHLIERDSVLQSLKQSLCSNRYPVCIAFHGLPGVGKTALSAKLVHDHDIRTRFCDGLLWAKVGPKPNMLDLLSRWGALLGIPAVQMEKLTTYQAWAAAIRAAINTRRIFLVIDDIWSIEDAMTLKVGGPNCTHLITTRIPDIALKFAPTDSIALPELNDSEGLALLTYFVPEWVSSEAHAAQELVQLVGGLPLALTLIGRYLQRLAYSGQPRRMKTALERLHDAEERLQLTEPQAASERSPNLPPGTPLSLYAVIETSDCQLDESTRQALYALSIFPAKPNSFSEEAALAVCAMPVETLDTLTDAGLLQSSGPGRYTLHQTIVDYARTKQRDKSVKERLVAYVASYVRQHAIDHEALETESNNILVALNIAYELQMQEELIRISNIFSPFFCIFGLYGLADEHLPQIYRATMALEDNRHVISESFYLGDIMHSKLIAQKQDVEPVKLLDVSSEKSLR